MNFIKPAKRSILIEGKRRLNDIINLDTITTFKKQQQTSISNYYLITFITPTESSFFWHYDDRILRDTAFTSITDYIRKYQKPVKI